MTRAASSGPRSIPSWPVWTLRPLLLVGLALIAVWLPASAGAWLWVLGLVLFGMPHGAYDLAALCRISAGARQVSTRMAIYAAIMLITAVLVLAAPVICVVCFLLLSAHHFGVSDSVWTRGRVRPAVRQHLAGFSHGLVVIGAVFLFGPQAAWAPFAAISGLAGDAVTIKPALIAGISGACVGLGALGAVVASVVLRRPGRELIEQWSVLAGATLLAALAPPLLAIAGYFLLVHAAGHCVRASTPGAPAAEPGAKNAARVHVASLPLLVPSLAIVTACAHTLFGGVSAVQLAYSFIFFCVLATLPHHLIWLGFVRDDQAR